MTVSMPYVKDDFQSIISDEYETVIMVTSAATSAFGGLLSIWLNYMLGRHKCVNYSNFGFLVGYMVYVFATAPWAIVLSRVVVGVATGVALTTAPFMVAEASDPQSIRGFLIGLLGLFFTVGVLLVNVFSFTLVTFDSHTFQLYTPIYISILLIYCLNCIFAGINMENNAHIISLSQYDTDIHDAKNPTPGEFLDSLIFYFAYSCIYCKILRELPTFK